MVHPADIPDRDGAKRLLAPVQDQVLRRQRMWADRADNGRVGEGVQATLGGTLESVEHWWSGIRWVVVRTLAWLAAYRRLKAMRRGPKPVRRSSATAWLMGKRLAQ